MITPSTIIIIICFYDILFEGALSVDNSRLRILLIQFTPFNHCAIKCLGWYCYTCFACNDLPRFSFGYVADVAKALRSLRITQII